MITKWQLIGMLALMVIFLCNLCGMIITNNQSLRDQNTKLRFMCALGANRDE